MQWNYYCLHCLLRIKAWIFTGKTSEWVILPIYNSSIKISPILSIVTIVLRFTWFTCLILKFLVSIWRCSLLTQLKRELLKLWIKFQCKNFLQTFNNHCFCLTPMLLVAKQNEPKNLKNYWDSGTWVLIWKYLLSKSFPMNPYMTGFRWFSKIFAFLCFGQK